MLDVRPTHWVTPLKEQPLDDLKPVVHVENFADEDCLVTGLVRIYRESTGTLVFDSVLLPTRVSGYQSAEIPTESTWSPGAPADHDYFIICETKAFDNLERHCFNSTLGPRFFDIKPGPMGPAPAAHAPTHSRGGMDVVEVEDLATDNTNAGDVLTSVGDGSICFSTPTGGSAGTPSDTVVSETSPGQSPAAGTATTYSRGDHTHGTPAGGSTAGESYTLEMLSVPDSTLFGTGDFPAHPWRIAVIGSGSFRSTPGSAQHPGVSCWASGSGSADGVTLHTNKNALLLAGSETTKLFYAWISGYRAVLRFGFHNSDNATEPTDGAYIELNWDVNGNTIYGRTATGGVQSTTGTTFLIDGTDWRSMEVVVNADASQVDFYIRNEAGATLWHDSLTTNIPKTAGHEVGCTCIMYDTRGSAVDQISIDAIQLNLPRTLTR
jgi:hypothetical protein